MSDDSSFEQFAERCFAAWKELFDAAKAKEEMQFALALNPENRGMQGAGWSTAEEARRALDEYTDLIKNLPAAAIRVRVALSLYSHLSEASGLYEVPKNMLRIASGDDYSMWPFHGLVSRHAESGAIIAPNANKVMRDLLGHAQALGFRSLETILLEAFDADLRNGYAHADYVIWDDGIRLPRRNGGWPKVIPFGDFENKINKALAVFQCLHETMAEYVRSYSAPKRIIGRLNSRDPAMPAIISFNLATGAFSIQSGWGL